MPSNLTAAFTAIPAPANSPRWTLYTDANEVLTNSGIDAVAIITPVWTHYELARTALHEGLIRSDTDLLPPRFYLAPGLENGLRAAARAWVAERPHWRL